MKHDATIGLFEEVLLKYRLVEPVPPVVHDHIRKEKGRQFKRTLRRAGGYSVLFAMVSDLFFALKKLGLPVTIVKSAAILGILAALGAVSVTSGIYLLVTGLAKPPAAIREVPRTLPGKQGGAGDEAREAAEPMEVIEDRIGVRPFQAVDLAEARAIGLSDRIAGRLARLRGGDRVINLRHGRRGKKSGMMLFGTVEHVEGMYTVTARVVNVGDARILFYDTETVATEDEFEAAGDRLAEKIYNSLR